MASSVWCQSQSSNNSNHDSKAGHAGKLKRSQNTSVIPRKICDFVFRRNADNRVYRSESFRFIQKTDSFITAGAARRSLKVPVIENYIDPVDHQEHGKEEPSYHEIVERYNAPYYYSDTIKEAVEPPYCSPCPTRKSSYNYSRRGSSRGQIVRKCNSGSISDTATKDKATTRTYIKNEKDIASSQNFCKPLLPRSKSIPFDSPNQDVDKLLEPIKSICLEDEKRPSSPPPILPQQRNQFISVCHILNSPSGTITNFSIATPSSQSMVAQDERSATGTAKENVVVNKTTSSHNNLTHSKIPVVPFTHKYLKASVARDKRLHMLKTSRSISSLDSAISFKSTDETRSAFDSEPHSIHSPTSTSRSGSSTSSGNNNIIANNDIALATLDSLPYNISYYSRPRCRSPECHLTRHSHHESSPCLPKLESVTKLDEIYCNSRPSWAGPAEAKPKICENVKRMSHPNERTKSRNETPSLVYSYDDSSTCSSGRSMAGAPAGDHHYTHVLSQNSDLDRLDEICYYKHQLYPHSVKVDVIHDLQYCEPCHYPNSRQTQASSVCNLPTFIAPHLTSNEDTTSNAHSDINYVKPHRCWNNNQKCNVNQYQFKVDLPLESQEWFHGAITRLESEKILGATKAGSFLVRNCENSTLNHFSLSIKCKRGFIHIRIEPNSGGTFTLAEQEFSSVPYLINHFMLNRLPIKGAEHVKLMYPVITQFL